MDVTVDITTKTNYNVTKLEVERLCLCRYPADLR